MKIMNKFICSAVLLQAAFVTGLQAQDDVVIKSEQLTDSLYVLYGKGGNIGLSVGSDGVYIIDDQCAPLTGKILNAIKEISDKPVRFVINTHYHGDHTGGNENLGKGGAVIIAHDKVRHRLLKKHASDSNALPSLTFNDQMSLHLNGEEARLVHVKNVHTDGDAMVFFDASNVIHMGDTYFNKIH